MCARAGVRAPQQWVWRGTRDCMFVLLFMLIVVLPHIMAIVRVPTLLCERPMRAKLAEGLRAASGCPLVVRESLRLLSRVEWG